MQSLKVTKKYDKKNVSKILFDTFPALTKNTLYKAFRQKDIKINGKRTSEDTPVYLENNNLGYDTSSTNDIFNKINLLLENNRERLLKIREAQFNYYGRDVTPKIVEYIANQLIND